MRVHPQQAFRWSAFVTYRTEAGPLPVQHDIEELEELQALVERGPDWNTIEKIEVFLQRRYPTDRELTVEEAARL